MAPGERSRIEEWEGSGLAEHLQLGGQGVLKNQRSAKHRGILDGRNILMLPEHDLNGTQGKESP